LGSVFFFAPLAALLGATWGASAAYRLPMSAIDSAKARTRFMFYLLKNKIRRRHSTTRDFRKIECHVRTPYSKAPIANHRWTLASREESAIRAGQRMIHISNRTLSKLRCCSHFFSGLLEPRPCNARFLEEFSAAAWQAVGFVTLVTSQAW